MKIVSIVGARPQFVKLKPMHDEIIRRDYDHRIFHTNQHYDENMSSVFFSEFNLPKPDLTLNRDLGSGHYELNRAITFEDPDFVFVYGDTFSTLQGAIQVVSTDNVLCHIEAGLRCGNRSMPEENIRIAVDHLSSHCFCPTKEHVDNLRKEGLLGVLTGDLMRECFFSFFDTVEPHSGNYILLTLHRAENTEFAELKRRIEGVHNISVHRDLPVIFPIHPRTRKLIPEQIEGFDLINPVPYRKMISLIKGANLICSDSGGLQREAFWAGKEHILLRNETEWNEGFDNGEILKPSEFILDYLENL